MENKEFMLDELYSLNTELGQIIDEMIAKYGKFVSLKELDKTDAYLVSLVSRYNKLTEAKDYLMNQIQVSE